MIERKTQRPRRIVAAVATVLSLSLAISSTTPAVAAKPAVVKEHAASSTLRDASQSKVGYYALPPLGNFEVGGHKVGPLEMILGLALPIIALILAFLTPGGQGSSGTNRTDKDTPPTEPTQPSTPKPSQPSMPKPSQPEVTYRNCNGQSELTRGCELSPNNWIATGEYLTFGLQDNGEIQYRVGSRVVGQWGGTGSGRVLRLNYDGRLVLVSNGETVFTLFGDRAPVDRVYASSDGHLHGLNGSELVWNDVMPTDVLTVNKRLNPDQMLLSRNGLYQTYYQSDGNLVTYRGSQVVWASNTVNRIGADMLAIMQDDGNFVIYVDGRPIWSSRTPAADGRPAEVLVSNEGELIVFRGPTRVWSSIHGVLGQQGPSSGFNGKVDAFVNKYKGGIWDYDGAYGAQCTDLFQFYNRDVVGAPYERFGGNGGAKNLWHVRTAARERHYHFLGAGTTPQKGDIAVWNNLGANDPWGHVAIVLENRGDRLLVLSQNNHPPYAGNTPTEAITMRKAGVIGYLRPKNQ